MTSIDKGANIRFEINSAVLSSEYFNFRNDFWYLGPIGALHKFIFRAVVSNKPNFCMMRGFVSVFPAFDNKWLYFKRNHIDWDRLSIDNKLINYNKPFSLLNCLHYSNDNSGSVPIHHSTHELFRLLEVLNGIKCWKRISDDKVSLPSRLFGLLPQWANGQGKCYASSNRRNPTAKGTEPVTQATETSLIIAKTISAEHKPGAVEQKDNKNNRSRDEHTNQEITQEFPHAFKPQDFVSIRARACVSIKINDVWKQHNA